MKITLIETVQYGTQTLCSGIQCDVPDDQAQQWIDAGQAVTDQPQAQPEPPADQPQAQPEPPADQPQAQPEPPTDQPPAEQPPAEGAAPVNPAKTGKAK